jgi:hypothetical protein
LTIIDVKTGKIIQQIGTGNGSYKTLGDGTVGPDGPYYSPDGKTLWFPQSAGQGDPCRQRAAPKHLLPWSRSHTSSTLSADAPKRPDELHASRKGS